MIGQWWADRRSGGFTQPPRLGMFDWHRASLGQGWWAVVHEFTVRLLPQRDSDGTFWIAEVVFNDEPVHSLTCATRRMAAKQAKGTVEVIIDTQIKDLMRLLNEAHRHHLPPGANVVVDNEGGSVEDGTAWSTGHIEYEDDPMCPHGNLITEHGLNGSCPLLEDDDHDV